MLWLCAHVKGCTNVKGGVCGKMKGGVCAKVKGGVCAKEFVLR